jgi:hypothetical protein
MDSLSMEGGVAVVEYKSRISNEKEKGTVKTYYSVVGDKDGGG